MDFKEITWGVMDLIHPSHNNISVGMLLTQ